jgi:hypothetical protein
VRWSSFFLCAALAFGQAGGSVPKPNAEDYESHGRTVEMDVGGEFMIHSFSGEGQTYTAKDYLVVEVALYPAYGVTLHTDRIAFSLRVNGKSLAAVPVSAVVYSLQHPDLHGGPRLEGGAGAGPVDVIFGRPQIGQPVPRAPRAPDPEPPGGIQPEPRVTADELAVRTALPRGDFNHPVSGFVYFPYRGGTASIKSVELLCGDVRVRLR